MITYASFTAHTKRISCVNTSMIVFDYSVRPTLILAAILGKVLQFAMGVHICGHNCHLYMSGLQSLLYFEAFKTRHMFVSM